MANNRIPLEFPGEYIPGLYIPTGHQFKPATTEIEEALSNFTSAVTSIQRSYRRKRATNMTPLQWRTMSNIQQNLHFITIEGDKNTGGCFLRRGLYKYRASSEHLSNTSVYLRLSHHEALIKHRLLRTKIHYFSRKYKESMCKAEQVYLARSQNEKLFPTNKFPRFRMTLKVHKKPHKFRPIKLKPFIPSYLKDSGDLLDHLKQFNRLPPNAFLFTADARSMYTNINTDHALEVIGKWLDDLESSGQLRDKGIIIPIEALKEALALVMQNNIFEFGDMYFLQLTGTAMGTSAACMWATIYFAIHEAFLLSKYANDLLLYKRFIDDMKGIWIGSSQQYEQFQIDTDNYGDLRWDFGPLTRSIDFLDLTISIGPSYNIITRTYQKPINLYQYIPPHSAHSPKIMKGVVYSLLRQYRRQNSQESDYIHFVLLLFKRLVQRGWDKKVIKQYILQADTRLSHPTQQPERPTLPNKKMLILHWIYHPNDIPRTILRRLYDTHCAELFKEHLDIQQFIIAYHSAPTLRSALTKAKLIQEPGKEASKYFDGELE
ncbi:hypothetical protein ACHAWT_001425 [Skeletonema menzelii]